MARKNGVSKGMSLGKVAEYCGVTRKTILRWAQDGMLPSFTLPGGHHRVLPVDLARFLESHNMPVPQELNANGHGIALVVDEDPHIRRLIRDLLAPHFQVEQAATLVEACLYLGRNAPDLLVFDYLMARADAMHLFAYMKKDSLLAKTKIVVTASEVTNELRDKLKSYSQQTLQKPFTPRQLIQACLELFPALQSSVNIETP